MGVTSEATTSKRPNSFLESNDANEPKKKVPALCMGNSSKKFEEVHDIKIKVAENEMICRRNESIARVKMMESEMECRKKESDMRMKVLELKLREIEKGLNKFLS